MARDNERSNRSDSYQWKINEVQVAHELLESLDNSKSYYHALDPFKYDERILELQDELKKEFWKIANKCLTDKQSKILMMRMDGYTQCEIAKALNLNQSSITKSLRGNVDYKSVDKKTGDFKQYGGSQKKLKKLCFADPKILEILQKIRDLREEKL